MEKEFVSYEIALALKELGFDEICLGFYKSDKLEFQNFISQNKKRTNSWYTSLNGCTAPTFSQAFRFFREKYGLEQTIAFQENYFDKGKTNVYEATIEQRSGNTYLFTPIEGYDTYEEAELECLKKLIEICKNN